MNHGSSGDERQKATVIGSGFGGLGAAIRLQSAGIKTVLYEARTCRAVERMYTKTRGSRLTLAQRSSRHHAHRTVRVDGQEVGGLPAPHGGPTDVPPDLERWRSLRLREGRTTMVAQIAERSQRDADGYQRFFEYAKKVFAKGYTELADRPFLKFSDMVAVSPSLIRLRADRRCTKP